MFGDGTNKSEVILAINTYIFALPAIILLNTARNFAAMSGRVQFLAKAPRWQFLIGVILIVPGSLLTLIFGVVGEGKRSHFVSAHGVSLLSSSTSGPY
jgi:hypothetical protein